MKTFGAIVKLEREKQKLLLREASAILEIDSAIISKIERGERKPSKKQVTNFADTYKLDLKELLIAWYSDKVVYEIQDASEVETILKVAESKVLYNKKK
jgi:transcriptional regulator with XRE-family HTH domain